MTNMREREKLFKLKANVNTKTDRYKLVTNTSSQEIN